jgi:hypothetical protein
LNIGIERKEYALSTHGEPVLISATVKLGDYQNTAFTLRAGSPEDFQDLIFRLLGEEAGQAFLKRFIEAFKNAPLYDVSGGGNSTDTSAKRSTRRGWGGGNRQRSNDDDPGRPSGPAPQCDHGEKVWRNPQDKQWKGWFCPENKRAGNCKTEWVND